MLSSGDGRYVIGNLGWVDNGSVWRFDSKSGRAESIKLSDADYLYISGSNGEVFTTVHHSEGKASFVTAQTFADPATAISTIQLNESPGVITGDKTIWGGIKKNFVVYPADRKEGAFVVSVSDLGAKMSRLKWMTQFDSRYQGVEDMVEIPETTLAAVSVQRSERLLICDTGTMVVKCGIDLPAEPSKPWASKDGSSIYVVAYSALHRIGLNEREIGKSFVDEPSRETNMFLGDLWMSPDESTLTVSRPNRREVIVFDTATFTIQSVAKVGGKPIESGLTATGEVIARDWDSGALLRAK